MKLFVSLILLLTTITVVITAKKMIRKFFQQILRDLKKQLSDYFKLRCFNNVN